MVECISKGRRCGFYADVAKGNVQYERDVSDNVFELKPPMKKRKLEETPKESGGDLPQHRQANALYMRIC
ncbi:hypothetical protein JG687_00015942 [Phytophthora cactorum]|uniref:Uncharacterized protein n=1 Tax=Phytophthora cactorum TaxID=29920 RepID=A0A8T1TUK3_9STRA|nr:hypothetical protein JG687_00015942 [Phytophthora cactorum]